MEEPQQQPASEAMISVSGRDSNTAVTALAPVYSGVGWYCRPVDERFWFKYVAVGDKHLSLRRLQMHGYLSGTASTGDDVVVQWLERGRGRVKVGENEIRLQAGMPPAPLPVNQQFRLEYEDWDQRLIHVRKEFLLDVATEQGIVDATGKFDMTAEPDAAALVLWQQSLDRAVEAFRVEGAASSRWRTARRGVAQALLQLYPQNAEQPTHPSSTADERVAAALDFVNTHAHEMITVTDIATAGGLSVRGLQEAFQRHVQRSPMAYLRQIRLERAREELQAAEPGAIAVADVAHQWGFSHLGRFAAAYLTRYGEYPRETLRSPRP